MRLADPNEDGRLDVVVASYDHSLLTWSPGQSPGHWGRSRELLRGARSFDFWVGDLDGDHHHNLLVPNRNESAMLLFGDGHGRFPGRRRLAIGPHGLGVLRADVDGDGDQDVMLTSATLGRTGHYVRLYRNLGSRRFERVTDIAVSESAQRLALVDVDGDGDGDLLSSAYVTDQVDLRLNDGRENFGPTQPMPTGRQPFCLAVDDIDADGKPDILTSSTLTHNVSLLRNQGQGRLAPPEAFTVA